MPSRLLHRLDAAIALAQSARDVTHAACLRAERAGVLARQGHLLRAREELAQLHKQSQGRPPLLLSAWLALSDGLADYYDDMDVAARDKIARAHALARAEGHLGLRVLAAAWLAQLAYVVHDSLSMAHHVVEALRDAHAQHHGARWRACLVVAQAYHFVARMDRANPWYELAREHATADGDAAALSTLIYNRASLLACQVRDEAVFGDACGGLALQALLSAESTAHFDHGVGTASLQSLVPMLRAQVLTVMGRCEEALRLFDVHLPAALHEGLARMSACLLADRAWCHWQLGHIEPACEDAETAVQGLAQVVDIDDRAVAQARLALLFEAMGQGARAVPLGDAARRDWRVHRSQQARLVALLDEALTELPWAEPMQAVST